MPNATKAEGTPAVPSRGASVAPASDEPPPDEPPPDEPPPQAAIASAPMIAIVVFRKVCRMSASSGRSPPFLSATGGSDTLPGRAQRPPLPRRLPPPPRDPDALERQRRLRPRQQRRVLLVLRHRHQRVADRGGRARHPRRPGDRAVRRVALPVPRGAHLPRHRPRRAARRPPG